MNKLKVVIVGGGFAGINFIEGMRGGTGEVSLTLVDPSPNSIFRPLLPDVLAGKVGLEHCQYSLPKYCRSRRIRFCQKAAVGLKGEKKLLLIDGSELDFDCLVVACGANPDYQGNESARKHAYTLYSDRDTARLSAAVDNIITRDETTSFVVVGGGYTGLETATALKYRIEKKVGTKAAGRFPVKVAEAAPRILAGLPDSIAGPVHQEIRRLGIEVITSVNLGEIGEDWIELNGDKISPTLTIWSAGVSAADFVANLSFGKDEKGRVQVAPLLHPPDREDIFFLGDCASFESRGSPLRMSIQFSLAQGRKTANNFRRRHQGDAPRPYRPYDYGYLVPLASGKAWGYALFQRVGGRPGSLLHYLMCVYRTWGGRNRWGVTRDLILGP